MRVQGLKPVSVSLVVSEEENGAVFQCEATSSSLEQPLVEQITIIIITITTIITIIRAG